MVTMIGILCAWLCWGWSVALLQQRDELMRQKDTKTLLIAQRQGPPISVSAAQPEPGTARVSPDMRLDNPSEKFVPIRLLDGVRGSLDPLAVWLVRLSFGEQQLVLEGHALSQQDLAQMIDNLTELPLVKHVQRIETRIEPVDGELTRYFMLHVHTELS